MLDVAALFQLAVHTAHTAAEAMFLNAKFIIFPVNLSLARLPFETTVNHNTL